MKVKGNRYSRLMHIMGMIQSRVLRAEDIAKECGISIRTVYRDIETLTESGIPIYFENGFHIRVNNILPPISLTDRERMLLRLIIESSPLNEIKTHKDELSMLWDKIAGYTTADFESGEIAAPNLLMNPDVSVGDIAVDNLLEKIEQSIADNLICEIEYKSLHGEKRKRKIYPYALDFRSHAFYLVAFCLTREKYRIFRIERISGYKLSNTHFTPDRNFNLEKYFRYSWGVAGGEPYDIKIKFSKKIAEMIKTGRRHHTEKINEFKNGSIEYSIRASGLEEISRWLVGFGAEAEVIYPQKLAEMVYELAIGASQKYKKKK